MEEETMKAETEQGDAVKEVAESSMDISNNGPAKRRRGRPQGSKKLKVCITDVSLTQVVSSISNGGSPQPRRGRGRPKLTVQEGSGDSHAAGSVETDSGKQMLKGSKENGSNGEKRKSRLKESKAEKDNAEDLTNGGSDTPKMGRGRPKGSMKRKSQRLTSSEEIGGSSVKPGKRGRPKGSLTKKPRLEREANSERGEESGSLKSPRARRGQLRKAVVGSSDGTSKTPPRCRGRPRKNNLVADDSQPAKRARGRPKGSVSKKPTVYKQHGKVGRPRRVHVVPARGRRGRPTQQPAKRGRPRKYPLPSPEELKKPKVWKPLGRPRKYPRVDPPEGAPPAPRRNRGRPRKSESKKGAHLRKSLPATPSSPCNPNGEPQRKRGRPSNNAKSEDATQRKRGRPKGSVNKSKARSDTQLDISPQHSGDENDSTAVVETECEGEPVENDTQPMPMEQGDDAQMTPTEQGDDAQMTPMEQGSNTDEAPIEQDVSVEVSDQA